MDNSNYELDYKAMFENLYKKFEEKYATEIEYFDLLAKAQETSKSSDLVSKNLMKMTMVDQILILRKLKELNDICAALQEKYKFGESEEE